MQGFMLSFEAIAPIFLLMLLGYLLKTYKVSGKEFFDKLNSFVFNIFLPVLLFKNIYETKSVESLDLRLIWFTVAGVIALFIISYAAACLISPINARRGVMLQAFFRSNYAILGIPLVTYICKTEQIPLTSMMVAVVVPCFNVLAVVALERFHKEGSKINYAELLKNIITNPLIIGTGLGLICLGLDIKLPNIIETTVSSLAAPASPIAIIVLGAGFEFSSIKGYAKEVVSIVLMRLIIAPLIMIPIAVSMGFKGEAIACVLIIFASPVSVSSYAMAKQMGGDGSLAAQAVVMTSVFSLFTLFGWIYVLSSLNLF